jgi:long-chain acyl-CoA synthetase
MCAGPAYHAAPLAFDVRSSMVMGIPLVFLDRWDSARACCGRSKSAQGDPRPPGADHVPAAAGTCRRRCGKYDVSSLRYIIHGAAPCPPEVKKAMIDWVGPIINEYYAGSEGGAGFVVSRRSG